MLLNNFEFNWRVLFFVFARYYRLATCSDFVAFRMLLALLVI